MAKFKCWEEVTARGTDKLYRKKGSLVMGIREILVSKSDSIGVKGKWTVHGIKPSGTMKPVANISKTKKEAIRKAESLIRKHDRCKL